jgi:hypothetical protein
VASIERALDRWGGSLLLVVKLIPGLSMIAIPMAGALRMDWRRFILFSSIGGMLWASIGLTAGLMLSGRLSGIVTLHTKPWMVGGLFLGAAIGSCAACVYTLHHVRVFRTLVNIRRINSLPVASWSMLSTTNHARHLEASNNPVLGGNLGSTASKVF